MSVEDKKALFEQDHIPLVRLSVWAVILVLLVVLVFVGVRQLFLAVSRVQNSQRVSEYGGKQIEGQRKRLRTELAGYGVSDAEKEIYRIPVEEAMKLLASEPKLVEGVKTPAVKTAQNTR